MNNAKRFPFPDRHRNLWKLYSFGRKAKTGKIIDEKINQNKKVINI
jgi:hypothetical protein